MYMGINVTERSRSCKGMLDFVEDCKFRCWSALSYFYVQWSFPNEKIWQGGDINTLKKIQLFDFGNLMAQFVLTYYYVNTMIIVM